MRVERVVIDGLSIPERHRQADPERVSILAESMKRHGQIQPITVYAIGEGDCGLVAGLHRLEAARTLGWDMIDAVFLDGNDVERELIEIAENLHRADLTKDERDRQIRRYAELLEVSRQNVAKPTPATPEGGRPKGIASQVAEQTGLSTRTVQRALKPPHEKRQRDDEKRDLQEESTAKLAALLAEHIPGEHWDALKATLYAAGCKKVAAEFERLVGPSVFDNTRSGMREG